MDRAGGRAGKRESRLLARRQLTRPGSWRSFVRRRVVVAVLVVAVIVALAVATDGVDAAGAVRGTVVMLLGPEGLDVVRTVRGERLVER